MSDNAVLMIVLFLSIVLCSGEPDIIDAIVSHVIKDTSEQVMNDTEIID